MNRPTRIPSVLLLGLASSLSVFGMAIVMPSVNSIAMAFDATIASAQFVISAYLFGLAIAQPASGVLCDRFGRRPVMLGGFALFTAASLLCAAADSLLLLILARFLQAVGVSVGTVTSRAILRDTRDGDRLAQAMSYIAAAMGLAPVVAPAIGGFIDSMMGYRVIFIVTAGLGCAVLFSMRRHLGETLSREHVPPNWLTLRSSYRLLLTSPQFLGFTLIYGFKQGTLFCFLAIGAAYFDSAYGMDAKTFGALWSMMAMTYVLGASLGARFTPSLGSDRIMKVSVWALFATGFLMLFIAAQEAPPALLILSALAILMFFAGSGTPPAMAGAIRHHPNMAGTASGLSSAIGLIVGGCFTMASGALYDGGFAPAALLMFAATSASAASWMLATRPVTRSGQFE